MTNEPHDHDQPDMNETHEVERELTSRVQPSPLPPALSDSIMRDTIGRDMTSASSTRPPASVGSIGSIGWTRWAVAALLVVSSALVGFTVGRMSNEPDLESIKIAVREELQQQSLRAEEERRTRDASFELPGRHSPSSRGRLMHASSIDDVSIDDRSL